VIIFERHGRKYVSVMEMLMADILIDKEEILEHSPLIGK
jgi:hypothetical protein